MSSVFMAFLALIMFFAATSNSPKWQVETVDQSGTGMYSSLRIDKAGNVHVAYVTDDESYSLNYAFWDHALQHWFVMNVGRSASFCSLTLDSKQRPHISWADFGGASGSKLRYAYWDGLSWKKQAIPLDSDIIGYYTSIALDSADRPSISFYEYRGVKLSDTKIRLRVVRWNGQYWEVKTIDGQEGSGKFNAIAIDARDHIHLAYANVSSDIAGMRYAFWDGKSWSTEIVDGPEQNHGGYVGHSACIALDKDGNPHISYVNQSTPSVKYAVRKNGRWDIQTVDTVLNVGYPDRNSIAVDDEGRPYIGYYDAARGILKVAHQEGQKWLTETVDTNASGFTSSMQIDQGWLWISYADQANRALKVARREVVPPHFSDGITRRPVQR